METLIPRFLADINVGRLGRWLRIAGYDVWIDPALDDGQLVALAARDRRVLLTRDRGILERRAVRLGQAQVVLLQDDRLGPQLRQVARECGLDLRTRAFSRCPECNEPLEREEHGAVRDRVPPYVFATQREFHRCPRCARLYWPGTHWEAMQSDLARALGERIR